MMTRNCDLFIGFLARWLPLGSCTGSLAHEAIGVGSSADPTGGFASGRVRRRWAGGCEVDFPIVDLMGPVVWYRFLRGLFPPGGLWCSRQRLVPFRLPGTHTTVSRFGRGVRLRGRWGQ